MKRRQALGAIGAILAAAVAPPFIAKSQLMPLKLIREVTAEEIVQYTNRPEGATWMQHRRYYSGWEYAYTEGGRDYYKPYHPTLKKAGNLGVAPTPAEMDMLGIDPEFARPVFVPKEKQLVDHSSKKINLLEEGFDAWDHEKQKIPGGVISGMKSNG